MTRGKCSPHHRRRGHKAPLILDPGDLRQMVTAPHPRRTYGASQSPPEPQIPRPVTPATWSPRRTRGEHAAQVIPEPIRTPHPIPVDLRHMFTAPHPRRTYGASHRPGARPNPKPHARSLLPHVRRAAPAASTRRNSPPNPLEPDTPPPHPLSCATCSPHRTRGEHTAQVIPEPIRTPHPTPGDLEPGATGREGDGAPTRRREARPREGTGLPGTEPQSGRRGTQTRSNRSSSVTLRQAATKSRTNFSFASSEA
ncbi:hypothetical protein QE414_001295 [Microbacterium sp. SORGH_AS 344]|nr:hypothetical protein [Microbacterium sp. SORGH_AS_0344]